MDMLDVEDAIGRILMRFYQVKYLIRDIDELGVHVHHDPDQKQQYFAYFALLRDVVDDTIGQTEKVLDSM